MTKKNAQKSEARERQCREGGPYQSHLRSVNAEKTASDWNAANPVGTTVEYWPVEPRVESEVKRTTTRSEAQVLGRHSAVVWLEGVGSCYALTHVRAVTP